MCSLFGFDPVFVFGLTIDRSCCGQIGVLRDCPRPEVCLICVCYIVICAPVKRANVISRNVNLPDESHLAEPPAASGATTCCVKTSRCKWNTLKSRYDNGQASCQDPVRTLREDRFLHALGTKHRLQSVTAATANLCTTLHEGQQITASNVSRKFEKFDCTKEKFNRKTYIFNALTFQISFSYSEPAK